MAATQTWNDGFLGLNWSTKERLAYAGDFNADGRQDLFFQAKTFPIVLPLAGFIVVPVPYGPAGMILHAGPTGHFSTINHQWGNGYLGISWDVDHYKPIIGQFDGGYGSDLFMQASNGGTAPIFVYSGITGGFESSYTLQMSGETMGYWGAGNAELSAGDLNGDGRADLVLAAQDGINSIAYTYHDGTIGVAEIYRPSAITEYQPTPIENGTPFNGVIAGRLSVSPTGAAIYSLPIELPPGIGGMQPTLSLEYNSQSGNGHLGMGWSLSGLSAIARCGATLAQDGFIDPVDFDGNDRLCLDGQRLVQVANTGCSGGVEYRTEIDSYARICAYGAQGSGPAWFKVWTKAGLTMEYGGTANARIEAQGRSDVLLWAMSKASDTVGNYLNVSYHEDNANGEFYPTRIDYTGNSNQGLVPYNSVRFSYEQRPDQSSGWVGGSRSGSSVRMTNVQAYTGNSLVRDYRFTYNRSPATGRSLLNSVTVCSGDDACLPEKHLGWSANPSQLGYGNAWISGAYPEWATAPDRIHNMDANGDGLSDIVLGPNANGQWFVIESTGTGFVNRGPWVSGAYGAWDVAADRIHIMDVDGDGLSDFVLGPNAYGQWFFLQNTGSSFVNRGELISGAYANWEAASDRVHVMDANGDGRSDIVLGPDGYGQWFVLQSTGSGFINRGPWISGAYGAWDEAADRIHVMDANGDGLSDFVIGPNANGQWFVLQNTGSSFDNRGEWISGAYADWATASNRVHVMDANGDGLSDVVLGPNVYGQWFVLQNTGTRFVNKGAWIAGAYGQWVNSADQIRVMDTNGDGLSDFVLGPNANGQWFVLQSMGDRFVDRGALLSGAYGNWSAAANRIRVMDANGDAMPDVVLGPDGSGNWHVVQNTTGLVDHLKSAVSANNVADRVTYAPLTDSAVYSKGSAAISYPQLRIQSPLHVVSEVSFNDGVGGTNVQRYSYTDARVDLHGRGFLGFRTVTAIDESTQIRTQSTYNQAFPYIGLEVSVDERLVNASTLLKTTSSNWSAYSPYTGVYQLRAGASTERVYELDGSLVTTVTNSPSLYDTYGNPGQVTVTTVGGGQTHSKTTVNTYVNDVAQWRLGRLTRASVTSTTPAGTQTRTSAFEYDSATGLISVEIVEPDDAQLMLRTEYGYDGFGNKTTVTVRDSGSNAYPVAVATSTTSFDYSPLAATGTYIITSTNAKAHTETQVIDARFGKPLSLTGPNGLTTQWQYDGFGRQIREIRADGTESAIASVWCDSACAGVANAAYKITTQVTGSADTVVYFDSLNREVRSEAVNLTGRVAYKDTQYNALGQILHISRPYLAGATPRWTSYQYDALGRAWKETSPDGGIVETTYNGLATTLRRHDVNATYDQTVTRVNDVAGNLILVVDEGYQSTQYEYDPFGNLTRVTDPAGNATVMSYDLRGRKLAMTEPNMGAWEYRYDALGQLRWQKDAKNQVTTMSYDVLGRMISRVQPEGTSTWTYDTRPYGVGKLSQVSGPDGYIERQYYDTLGRPQRVERVVSGTTLTTSTAYDAYGRVARTTYPSGFVLGHQYNARGHLYSLVNHNDTSEQFWTAQSADAEGHITQELLGNGLSTVRTYDPASGRLGYLGTYGGTTNVQMLNYQYDALGNLRSREDVVQGLSETFQYDAFNRLAEATIAGVGTKTWSYDGLGNITSKDGHNDYAYTGGRPHAVTYARGTTHLYDANGSLVLSYGAQNRTITWNSANLPTRIWANNNTVEFSYTPDGARYRQVATAGGVSTTTLYAGSHHEQVTRNGVTTHKDYIAAAGRVVAVREVANGTASVKYLHQDHLGSTDVITDATGQVLERQSFDAFGGRRVATTWHDPVAALTSLFSTRGYTGHEQLDGVGLIHMNGRVYDPQLGRFLSADPYVKYPAGAQGLNRYSYTDNNPLSRVDPSGYGWLSKAWKKIKKWVKPIVAAVAAYFTAGWAYAAYMGSAMSAAGGAMAIGGAQFAAASLTGSIISGSVAGATFGFTNTLLHRGSIGEAFGAGVVGGVTGAMFGAVAGRYGSTWNLSRVTVNGVLGGAASKAYGGKFADGFKFMFMTASARLTYNAILKYDVSWKSAAGLVDADGAYDEGSFAEPIRVPELGNTFGVNDELTGRFWRDFFKQGGALSVVANRIPGLQSTSKLHDYYQLGFDRISGFSDSILRTVGNVPAMVPAGLITYGALLNDTAYLAAGIYRRNDR